MSDFKYRPDVDGLRAVAVVLVLLFHAGLGFSGGYVGVDVFFVISGFLITGLILKKRSTGSFSLTNFWVRRIRRIIPAATLMVVLVLIAGYFLLLPGEYQDLGKSSVAQQLMLSNFYFWKSTGYFDGPADTKPLLHTWSLAVEEQFYLFYPFLLVFLQRFGRRTCGLILGCVALLSFGTSQFGVIYFPNESFYLLPTRTWELLLGGLIWYLPPPGRLRSWFLSTCSWAGLVGIVGTGWVYQSTTPFPGFNAALPCLAAAAIIYCNSEKMTGAASLLAKRPVVFIGLISYSLYLWHWPLLAFTRYWVGNELSPGVGITLLFFSLILAYLSWRFVETPFRTSKLNLSPSQIYATALASVLICIGFAGIVYVSDGLPQRIPESIRPVAAQIPAPPRSRLASIEQIRSRNLPKLGLQESNAPIDFLLWCDSHGHAIDQRLSEMCSDKGLSAVIAAKPGTVPLLGVWRPLGLGEDSDLAVRWNQAVMKYIHESEIKNVVLVSRWTVNVEGRSDGMTDSLIALEGNTSVSKEEALMAFEAGLELTFGKLHQEGVRVWILKQVPKQPFSPQRTIVQSLVLGNSIPHGISREQHQQWQGRVNKAIDLACEKFSNVTCIDQAEPFFDDNNFSRLGDERGVYYRDDNHVSNYGIDTILSTTLGRMLDEVKQSTSPVAQQAGASADGGR